MAPHPFEQPLRHDAGAARGFEHAHARLEGETSREVIGEAVKEEGAQVLVVVGRNVADERRIPVSHERSVQARHSRGPSSA